MQQSGGNKVLGTLKRQGIVMALVVIYILFAIASPQFRSLRNVILILRQVATIGVMAAGMTFVIIGGNFDLSVGSLLSLCSVLCIGLHDRIGPVPAMLVAIIAGLASGAVSGFLVGYLKLNSMIVTLGMMNVIQALALMVTNGRSVYLEDTDVWFCQIGKGNIAGFPISAVIMILYIILMAVILMKRKYGHQILSTGGNAEACRYSGIDDRRVLLKSFVLSGLSAAVGAILLSSRGGSAQPTVGQSYEFDVITAVILGGASLAGGSGNIYKTFVGVLILGILKNGFVMMGFPYYVQWIAQCLIMLVAVYLDMMSKKKKGAA
ncbi:MAG: ABC transporter permease [Blautia sp.]|nr:ABC transporter permease [Blautia sp.]